MLVAASEEVGNADPMAICVAASAAIGVERVGMPEGRIILAQAAAYIASVPKSNSAYLGIEKALSIVRKTGNLPIPSYLQDSSYKGAKKLGRGIGYKYAHNYPNHWVEEIAMPKIKTRRAAAKRFTVTGSGEFKRNKAFKSHILEKKSPKRKRNLRKATLVAGADFGRVKNMLPNG